MICTRCWCLSTSHHWKPPPREIRELALSTLAQRRGGTDSDGFLSVENGCCFFCLQFSADFVMEFSCMTLFSFMFPVLHGFFLTHVSPFLSFPWVVVFLFWSSWGIDPRNMAGFQIFFFWTRQILLADGSPQNYHSKSGSTISTNRYMIKSTLKIARCPLVIQGFSNFLGLFQVLTRQSPKIARLESRSLWSPSACPWPWRLFKPYLVGGFKDMFEQFTPEIGEMIHFDHIIFLKRVGTCHYIIWLYTLPEANIAPENVWLEDSFPFGMAYFQGLC